MQVKWIKSRWTHLWEGLERKVLCWNSRKPTVLQIRPQETPVEPYDQMLPTFERSTWKKQGKISGLLFCTNKLKWLWPPHFFHGVHNFYMTPLGYAKDHSFIVSETAANLPVAILSSSIILEAWPVPLIIYDSQELSPCLIWHIMT